MTQTNITRQDGWTHYTIPFEHLTSHQHGALSSVGKDHAKLRHPSAFQAGAWTRPSRLRTSGAFNFTIPTSREHDLGQLISKALQATGQETQ